jgi:hypothetical protein
MTPRFARGLAALYFAAYVVAVTWPGMTLFNRVEPLVLGLPLNMVWVAAWVVGGAAILWIVFAAERRAGLHRENGAAADAPQD